MSGKELMAEGAAAASGVVKAAPPVAVSGAMYMGFSVPELIQWLTLLWLVYQFVDAVWTGYPKWRGRVASILGAIPRVISALRAVTTKK